MNTTEGGGWNARQFGLRVNEVVALGTGAGEPKEIPKWVWNVAKKLWFDFMGRNCPLPIPENRTAFTTGLLFGALPNEPLDGTPSPDVVSDGRTRASGLGDNSSLSEAMAKMQAGVVPHQLFTDEQLGATLRGFRIHGSRLMPAALNLVWEVVRPWWVTIISSGEPSSSSAAHRESARAALASRWVWRVQPAKIGLGCASIADSEP